MRRSSGTDPERDRRRQGRSGHGVMLQSLVPGMEHAEETIVPSGLCRRCSSPKTGEAAQPAVFPSVRLRRTPSLIRRANATLEDCFAEFVGCPGKCAAHLFLPIARPRMGERGWKQNGPRGADDTT